jgi:hypothetical protein
MLDAIQDMGREPGLESVMSDINKYVWELASFTNQSNGHLAHSIIPCKL